MTLYETIAVRRSVRTYDKAPLSEAVLKDIEQYLGEIKQIPGAKAMFKIVSGDEVKGTDAPYAILAYCSGEDAEYANVGYVLEKADLYIQSIGLGSVWLGMAKPKEKQPTYCIMLAFGPTSVPLRSPGEDFKRLSVTEITETVNDVARAARLAPSAMNSQPWKLRFAEDKITVRLVGRGPAQMILRKRLNKIDIGIVTRHICEALLAEGKNILTITPKTRGKHFKIEIALG
jgi:nitroreductase